MKRTSIPRQPVIGLIANNVGGYSRGVIRGVAQYAFARNWTCRVQGVNEFSLSAKLHHFDGLITQAASAQQLRRLEQVRNLPVVNISSSIELERFPSVVSDDRAIGRMGADYFDRKGYRHLAFFAPDNRRFAKLRHDGFAGRLAERRLTTLLIDSEARLLRALRSIETPAAVMACNDRAALAVIDAAQQLGLKIPDQLAIMGVDNDDLVQSLAYPPLTTINTARERIGFEAAAKLERLMRGQNDGQRILRVPPQGVIERQSTEASAIDDADVVEAVRFIRASVGRAIGVEDVLAVVPLSRRQLERRFREALGRSILDEIQQRRIDRARQLLSDTELTLPQIATATGFSSASYFSVIFRKLVGVTPGQFRG